MARQLRIEYPGAFYHVMARGDRREPIVEDDTDRADFVHLLGRVCAKTGWRVHAWVLMTNHYHWLIETPEPNLVTGMKWFQNTFTRRYNVRHRRWGHVFGGRYKAVLLDPEDAGGYYFESLIDYIHLNPARAGMVEPTEGAGLLAFPWSSLPMGYAAAPSKRPDWMNTSEGFAVSQVKDTTAGRRRYVQELEKRWKLERSASSGDDPEGKSLQSTLRRGWYWGSEAFKEKLIGLRTGEGSEVVKSRDYRSSQLERDHSEARAEKMVAARLREEGLVGSVLEGRPGNDPWKVKLAAEVWENTSVSQAWIADRLRMGSAGNVSLQLHRYGRGD